ncbi:hypothetical protein V6N11_080730 [Hibiscus sabdariffa]|uniref:Uncharacterized protein n=1 Tax=Hibiscus sabdariffa TaxID=183260 RepID=A0ABR2QHR2_9ROSI
MHLNWKVKVEMLKENHKWQKTASIGRKRVASARDNKNMAAASHSNKSSVIGKGCFTIYYTMDNRHLVIPLVFLDNCIVILNCLPCETRIGLGFGGSSAQFYYRCSSDTCFNQGRTCR